MRNRVHVSIASAARSVAVREYELLVAIGMVVFAVVQFGTGDYAFSVQAVLHNPLTILWSTYLLSGGVLVIAGACKGLVSMEVLGLRLLASAGVVYAVCIPLASLSGASAGSVWETSLTAVLWLTVSVGHVLRSHYLRHPKEVAHRGH